MEIKGLELEEIGFEEYNFLREDFPWPCHRIPQDVLTGFARVSSGLIFKDIHALLGGFSQCPNARRASIKTDEGWMRVDAPEIDDSSAEGLLEIISNTHNLLYLGFKNGIFDPNVNFEVGFGREPEGKMVSVCACLPGYLRGKEYQWKGSDREYVEIYALA